MSDTIRLEPDQLAELARAVAAELRASTATTSAPVGLVSAAALAPMLGVSRSWVYEHAGELGGVRLGGARGRLRFDPDAARAALSHETGCCGSERSQAPNVNVGGGSRRPRRRVAANGSAHWPLSAASDDPLPSRPHAQTPAPTPAGGPTPR
jgi:hypothetical protein